MDRTHDRSRHAPRHQGSRAYRVGAWLVATTGAAHLMALAAEQRITDPAHARVWGEMTRLAMFSPGIAHTMADFHLGNSLAMGVMYVAFAALALTVERTLRGAGLAMPRALVLATWIPTALSVAVAAAFFPAPPLAFFVGALVAFSLALRAPRVATSIAAQAMA